MSRRSSREIALDALQRWVAALPSPSYDVAMVPVRPGTSPVQRRRFTEEELLGALGWLSRGNLDGHVYVRPAATHHVLLDDLDPTTLARLRHHHRIAALVETSALNFQAWVTVTDHPIPVALASAVARVLAQRFGGDLGSADASHLGRAPGFVNRKPVHENPAAAGRFPWVHLRSASAGVCPRGVEILAEGQALLDTRVSRPPGPTCSVRPTSGVLSLDAAACAAARWRLGFAVLLPPGQRVDRSRIDHSVARHLLRAGAAPAVVADVLRGGDRAQEMQPARRDAYVQRTVEAALAAHREVRR